MPKPTTFATRLKSLRSAAGLTQAQLASAAECSEMAVRQWESDRRRPSLDAAVRLARALGCDLNVLAGWPG